MRAIINTMAISVCTNFNLNEDWKLLISPLAPQSRLNRCDVFPRAYFLKVDKRALSIHNNKDKNYIRIILVYVGSIIPVLTSK